MHYFYVPNRIIWDEWEDFFTGGDDGTAAPTFPKATMSSSQNIKKGKLPALPLVLI